MSKDKISDYSSTANSNTDIAAINIDEGCAPSGINNAIRALMAQLKNFQTGASGDSFNGPVGSITPAAGAFTTLTTSSTVTHNGGTANGVAYLNGSKVLTTGSALVFDGSNIGLGVTPSAWSATYKALQVGATASIWSGASGELASLQSNAYFNGTNYVRLIAGYATGYDQSGGAHSWKIAGTSTAGSNISFTQAMTLDASGNLGVGTTSPSFPLDVVSNSAANAFKIRARSGNDYGFMQFSSNDGATRWAEIFGIPSGLVFTTGSSGTERARIDTSGNFLLATSAAKIGWGSTGANYIQANTSTNVLAFGTNSSEAMRIESSGNLLIGATSAIASEKLYINGSNTNYITRTYNSNASPYGAIFSYTGAAPNGTSNEFFRCDDTGAVRMAVRSNGGIANFSANNVNLSDQRTKTDIQNAGGYLAKICAIPVRTFKYKDQTDDLLNLGVIAQEVETVAPELVDVSGFGETPEDGVPLKAIYQTDLQYALMKCIQEQQAIIESLKARLDAANL